MFIQDEESNCNQNETSKQTRYRDLIPFIMMYIFLNYDCLTSSSSSKIRLNMKKEARKESDLKKMILKTAKDCAKFCENKSNQEEERKFSEQCLKKVKKNLKLKAKPNQEVIDSIQKKIDVFDKMFYVKTDDYDQISSEDVLCDGNQINDDEDLSESSEDEEKRNKSTFSINCERNEIICDTTYQITQLDGNVSESSEDEKIFLKSLFSVKCETKEITQLLTFFRSFDLIWRSLASHKLCSTSDGNCFFCHMRSSCLRLRATRGRGPKSLKLIEFTSQLTKYQSVLGWNWRENIADLPSFVQKTLQLLDKHESKTFDLFEIPDLQCQKCKKIIKFADKQIFDVDTSSFQSETKEINLKLLMEFLFKTKNLDKCCSRNLNFNNKFEKCVILRFSHAVSVNIAKKENLYGRRIKIISLINQMANIEENMYDTNFKLNDKMYCQNSKDEICKSDGTNVKIKLMAFLVTKPEKNTEELDMQHFIFDTKLQKQLYKQYDSVLSPEKYLQTKLLEKEYELERSKDQERIEYRRKIDQARDITPKRNFVTRLKKEENSIRR